MIIAYVLDPLANLNLCFWSKFQNHEFLWQWGRDIFVKLVNKQLQQKILSLGECYLTLGTSENQSYLFSIYTPQMKF